MTGLVLQQGRRTLVTDELPDVSDPSGVPEDVYREYATATNDDWRKVKMGKYRTRVIGGLTVYASGERWGVLILDSSDPQALSAGTLEEKLARITLRVLSSILEKERP